ncbi:selenoprotein k [Anaeramoeba flamelloides]|uniref:Selenoprotein k n=1 Tax=Anaeramoeba flamelloides TaxID=1746091 RepID=A0AAV7Y5T4_9EUKA|nr:selenoprotein k [Anaeramoeba flamelloides]
MRLSEKNVLQSLENVQLFVKESKTGDLKRKGDSRSILEWLFFIFWSIVNFVKLFFVSLFYLDDDKDPKHKYTKRTWNASQNPSSRALGSVGG